jgi:F-type H+-transporting ATPase subunit b
MYEKADKAKTDAQALQEEYTLRLAEAAETGERMVREAVARGHSREEEILRNANEKASAMMDKAAADIEREKKKALNDAKDQISVIAIDIAGKVVGRSIDSADQSRLVDSFIESLGDEV